MGGRSSSFQCLFSEVTCFSECTTALTGSSLLLIVLLSIPCLEALTSNLFECVGMRQCGMLLSYHLVLHKVSCRTDNPISSFSWLLKATAAAFSC